MNRKQKEVSELITKISGRISFQGEGPAHEVSYSGRTLQGMCGIGGQMIESLVDYCKNSGFKFRDRSHQKFLNRGVV